MKKTSLKLSIAIEQDRRLGLNIRGEFNVTDMLFSDYNTLLDAEQMIKDVRQCIKALKGFSMVTIRLTDGEQFALYPTEIHSVRFTNHYGEIKMAHCNNGTYYDNWEIVKESEIYENVRELVKRANQLQVNKIAERNVSEAV